MTTPMNPDIKRLIDGNKQFKEKYFASENPLFEELRQGQKPKIMMVTCSDSRVDPAVIFNCQPGDLFVVRNIANLIPPCEGSDSYHGTSAALEFATCFLEVDHIIVFGHTQCGGIQALLRGSAPLHRSDSFIAKWLELAKPAYTKIQQEHKNASLDEQATLCEQYALINSLQNLSTFPWIYERVAANKLSLHAWYFDLVTGGICMYEPDTNRWVAP